MTATVKQLEQRLKERVAPLFCQTGPSAGSGRADERIPPGFVGNEETADCREKLRELLEKRTQNLECRMQNEDCKNRIANELDRRAAERIFEASQERRLTKAEANFITDLFGSYENRRSGHVTRDSR